MRNIKFFSIDTWLGSLVFVYSRVADCLPKMPSASSRQELQMEEEGNILAFKGEFYFSRVSFWLAMAGSWLSTATKG